MKQFHIQWHLLDRCNLCCRHCYQEDFSEQRELGWEGLRQIADTLLHTFNRWGTRADITLTGGEPLLKEELMELLRYLDNATVVGNLEIITNGLLLSQRMEGLRRIGKLRNIRISLDGVTEMTNDSLRGRGAFVRLMEEISTARRYGLPLSIMFTAMRRNLHEVIQLDILVRRLGLGGYIVERFFPLGQGKQLAEELLTPRELYDLWQSLLRISGLEVVDPQSLVSLRALKITFARGRRRVYRAECIAGKDGLALLPDGTVLPCRRFPFPLGNVRERPLLDIWEGAEILRRIRKRRYLKGACAACEVKTCYGCRALSYCLTGDPLAEDPHCLKDIIPPVRYSDNMN